MTEARQHKVLLIGLDGATFNLLDPLSKRGLIPCLESLHRESASGVLLSTIPPFTVPAWSSMMTGKGPGKHSVISFFEHKKNEYQCQSRGTFVNTTNIVGETLWEAVSNAEKRVIVVNFPMTYPPQPVNGYLITGMLTPYSATDFTYPPELAEMIGDYQIDLQYSRKEDRIDVDAYPEGIPLIDELQNMTRRRGEVSLRLMRENPWDLFAVAFTATDRMCHFFWPDLIHPDRGQSEIVAATEAYYRELDQVVGQLIDEAGPEALVLIVSDHGFGMAPQRRFYPNLWLEQQNWLHRHKKAPKANLQDTIFRQLYRMPGLRGFIKGLLPGRMRDQARSTFQEDLASVIDWSRTSAYFVPMSNNICGVEINRVGTKRDGFVLAEDVENLRNQIISAAKNLVDPETGEKFVLEAQPRESIYNGPYVDTFPDVILTLKTKYGCSTSLRGKNIVEINANPRRPGEHRREGILLAKGAPILPGAFMEPVKLEDIMPTILYLMDLDVPDDLDGNIIRSIIDPAYQRSHPAQYRTATNVLRSTEKTWDNAQQAVEERLKTLGYL